MGPGTTDSFVNRVHIQEHSPPETHASVDHGRLHIKNMGFLQKKGGSKIGLTFTAARSSADGRVQLGDLFLGGSADHGIIAQSEKILFGALD